MLLSLSTFQYLFDNSKPDQGVARSSSRSRFYPRISTQLLKDSIYTLYLFTKADYHTLFFPIMFFAIVAGPVRSPVHFFISLASTWLHMLQCNISNQYCSVPEDTGNKPWRPIPSGRVTVKQASTLHAIITALCLLLSLSSGLKMVLVSFALTITTILYDNFRWSAHCAQRVVLVVMMYGIFEYGATKFIAGSLPLDNIAWAVIASSLVVIATTAHVGDFPDVDGDKEDGRWTIPIAFPETSRIITPALLVFWSIAMAQIWELGIVSSVLLVLMGSHVAVRNFVFRDVKSDKRTYVLHSIWLLTLHLLPINARWNMLKY